MRFELYRPANRRGPTHFLAVSATSDINATRWLCRSNTGRKAFYSGGLVAAGRSTCAGCNRASFALVVAAEKV